MQGLALSDPEDSLIRNVLRWQARMVAPRSKNGIEEMKKTA